MKKLLKILVIQVLLLTSISGCATKNEKMTLKEKVTQMIMPSFRYQSIKGDEIVGLTTVNDELKELLEEYKFAGVILFAENLESSEQAFNFIKDLKTANASNDGTPLLIGVDQEGGYVWRLGFGTTMPGNMALCATGDANNAYESAKLIGNELSMLGINLNYAPVVDVNSNPNNPIIGIRAFSDNPLTAKDYIIKSIEGYHDTAIATCIKHFPGHGNTDVDSHTGLPLVNKTIDELKEIELETFKYGIDANTDMIMTAHIQFPKIDDTKYIGKENKEIYLPATLSKKIINILREDYNYDGVICTDALLMDAIQENYRTEDVAELAINAGIDILLMPVNEAQDISSYIKELKEYIDMVCSLVEEGKIEEKRIDEAVDRILKLKAKREINDKVNENIDYTALIGSKENHDKELEITKKAITLVENDNVLPLNKDNRTLILYPYGSQENSLIFAKNILLEKGFIKDNTIDIHNYGEDDEATFKKYIDSDISKYDNVIIISNMYSNVELNDDFSKLIDYAFNISKEKSIKTTLISANLPYDLARFEADSKLAIYYGSGMRVIPTNYDEDVRTYAPNIPAAILLIFGDGEFTGILPVDIPEVIYDEKENQYIISDKINYSRED